MAKRRIEATDPVVSELQAIKKLLMLALLRDGTRQSEIAAALGVDASAVSRMMPARSISQAKATNR
jgi:hypothetical protein